MRYLAALIIIMTVGASSARSQSYADASMQTNRTGLSIVENGTDRMNNRIFTVQADHIELVEVLKTFFKRAGAEVAIDQDVSGHVDLSIKNVTFREALQWIVCIQFLRMYKRVLKSRHISN